MTDPEHAPEDQQGLDPGQEARLRRLLARARHDEPVPDDVAARLDRVLADLRHPADDADDSDDSESDVRATTGSTTDELASRRRRVAGLLLAAAAFVVVAGVAVHALRDEPGVTDTSTSASTSASTESGAAPQPRGEAPPQDGPDGAAKQTAPAAGDTSAAPFSTQSSRGLPVLTDAGFSDQVRSLLRSSGPGATSSAPAEAPQQCRLPVAVAAKAARTLDVVYHGAPAALVVSPRQGQSQVVDLARCGSGQVLRSVTLAR